MESYVCCRMKDITVIGIVSIAKIILSIIITQESLHLMLEKSQDYQILLIIILLIIIKFAFL